MPGVLGTPPDSERCGAHVGLNVRVQFRAVPSSGAFRVRRRSEFGAFRVRGRSEFDGRSEFRAFREPGPVRRSPTGRTPRPGRSRPGRGGCGSRGGPTGARPRRDRSARHRRRGSASQVGERLVEQRGQRDAGVGRSVTRSSQRLPPFHRTASVVAATSSSTACDNTPSTQRRTRSSAVSDLTSGGPDSCGVVRVPSSRIAATSRVLGREVPVERVVRQAGRSDDVGHPGPAAGPAPSHDLAPGVEEPADLVRRLGTSGLERPLGDAAHDVARSLAGPVGPGGRPNRNRRRSEELTSSSPESYSDLDRGCQMSWDFETEPEFQKKLDWADEFVREEVEPLDLLWGGLEFTPPDDRLRRVIDPLKAEVRSPGAVGHPPGPGARWRGLRPAQAVPAQRDPRAVELGPDHLRLPGARHRQRRDHRPLRHRRAEGALPATVARG